MIIKRNAFRAVLPATNSNDTRYVLRNIQVETDNSLTATNGHILLRAIDRSPFADADFPVNGVAPFKGNPTGPILIPSEVVDKVAKTLPKKTTIPILQTAQITINGGGYPAISTTDLQGASIVTVDQTDLGQFPNWQRIMPKADRPVIKVCLAVDVLAALIQSAQAAGSKTMTFSVPTVNPVVNEALFLEFSGPDITVEGLAMPCRA